MTQAQKIWYGRQFGAKTDIDAVIECAYRLALGANHDLCAHIRRVNGWWR